MASDSLEMETLTEKLLKRSLDGSFSDDETEENDIVVHDCDDGPSTKDRQLLEEENELEELLTRKRNKVFIGNRVRRKSVERYLEDGTLGIGKKKGRSKVRQTMTSDFIHG